MIQPMRPLTSILPTKAAQIPMAPRHYDTANDPAYQRHAAFRPIYFAFFNGTASHKRVSHQGRINPNDTANTLAIRPVHILEANISYDIANDIQEKVCKSKRPSAKMQV